MGWLRELNARERKTMLATGGGWALDAFDVQVYSFIIPTLIAAWNLSRADAGVLGTSTLLISALGGWGTGILCDRFGRVRMLQITIVWFAFFTFLSGFTNNFTELLICRSLQGLGFGGEWAAGSVLMGEVIRAKYRGRAFLLPLSLSVLRMGKGGWGDRGYWTAIAVSAIFLRGMLPCHTAAITAITLRRIGSQ